MGDDIALDIVFDTIDDWLLNGQYEECGQFLAATPVESWSTPHLLTMLTATLHAASDVPERAAFYDRVERLLGQRCPNAGLLLQGLKAPGQETDDEQA